MNMTEEQVNEKFKGVELKFDHYYKFTFGFEGVHADGTKIYVTTGGNSDDIYKMNVDVGKPEKFEKVGDWNTVRVYEDPQDGSGEKRIYDYESDNW